MSEDTPTPDDLGDIEPAAEDLSETEAELAVDPSPTRHSIADDLMPAHLRGMYRSWFLDYASYVILERAVPEIADGLKPVQRRILHSMKTLDDGRYNKVANIVGNTMQYHPHGDASIYEALVQLGQKDLLVETQGNWGNILTGASAAAGRYIEARLSQFALDVLFSPKVTDWTLSYDGRKKEPVTLPAKFPLLLAQGVEGIAVGLSSKILPHNFNEILDAAVAYLRGEEFKLYPDFVTGGLIDVSRYNDGERGGSVKVRAKIEKIDNKTLAITEIPYGKTTGTLIDSILKAFESGKIKIRKVDDNTAAEAMIVVHLMPGTSSDKTIDALYAFTDCEVSISPNCCVIRDDKPHFVGVSDVLKFNVDYTREIFRKEFEIQLGEVREMLFFATLEQIFIEERIYKDKEYENAASKEAAILHIDRRFEPFKPDLYREVTHDDIERLLEIKMGRIIRFNARQQDELIASYRARIEDIKAKLANLTDYTIGWYEGLREKYGAEWPRRTQLRSFDSIQANTVAEVNEKLYIDREGGFIGTALRKDEYKCDCSSIDDILIIYKDGRYKVVRVAEKLWVGKDILWLGVFKPKDERTIYNIIYQNGKSGPYYMKRCAITGVTRDKEYNLTPGAPGTKIRYLTVNHNGEAETISVNLREKPRLKALSFDVDFSKLAIKGKGAVGNLVTKNEVKSFTLKEKGVSTLGGRKVWFDHDVLRLNYNAQGEYLGEFHGSDSVLVILKSGEYYMSTFEATNHYEDNILRIEKFREGVVWTAVLFDADQGYPYLKRFTFEPSAKKQRFIGDNDKSTLLLLTDTPGARVRLTFAGADSHREPMEVDAEEFVGSKSFRAKGKRLTTWQLQEVIELEPSFSSEEAPETADSPESEPEEAATASQPSLLDPDEV